MKDSLCILVCLVVALCGTGLAEPGISLDSVDGLWGPDSIQAGKPVTFYMLWDQVGAGYYVSGSSNGYRLYSPSGTPFSMSNPGEWNQVYPWEYCCQAAQFVFYFDGIAEDTVGFGCASLFDCFIWDGTYDIAHIIHLDPIDKNYDGDTICIDSTWFLPDFTWMWSGRTPSWSGPHCFMVFNCCVDERGDVDANNSLDVGDLSYLISFLFRGGPEIRCSERADVNDTGGTDVGDLTYLVDYFFRGGPAPLACD